MDIWWGGKLFFKKFKYLYANGHPKIKGKMQYIKTFPKL